MIGRLKFDIQPLVREMLDQLPDRVWQSSTTTFLDPAMGGGQFVVKIEQRLREYGHSEANIAERVFGAEQSRMRLNFAVQKHKLVGKYAVGGINLDYEEVFGMKNFDVVVGNPPFQEKSSMSTNTKQLYVDFAELAYEITKGHLIFIIPSRWAGNENSNLRKKLFNCNHLKEVKYLKDPFSGVKVSTCMIHVDKTDYYKSTTVTDALKTTQQIDLTKVDKVFLKNLLVSDILEKTSQMPKLSHRWHRGGLNGNNVTPVSNGKYTFITGVGEKGEDYKTIQISDISNTVGFGQPKICIPNMGTDLYRLGQAKVCNSNDVGGHSVVFLYTNSKDESDKLVSYLNTKFVRFLVMFTKPSTPNSKSTFSNIPDIDLKNLPITDKSIYSYFNLSENQINLIESYFNK